MIRDVMEKFAPAARFLFALTFLMAAAPKIIDPAGFAESVFRYQMLPGWLIYPVALILPWFEAVCGLLLLAGAMARSAAGALNALLACFVAVLGVSIARGLDIDCGCFGPGGGGTALSALWRDLCLLAVGLFVQFTLTNRFSSPNSAPPAA